MSQVEHETFLKVLDGTTTTQLDEALTGFLLDCQAHGLAAGTMRYYKRHVLSFVDFLLI